MKTSLYKAKFKDTDVEIIYNTESKRGEVNKTVYDRIFKKEVPVEVISFALFKLPSKEDRTFFDSIKAFFLKNFTWTWLVVRDDKGNETDEIINIDSIARRTGLKAKEIKEYNKNGNLYSALGGIASLMGGNTL